MSVSLPIPAAPAFTRSKKPIAAATATALLTAALLASPARASITVQGTEVTPYTPVTNQLAMSHGVTFSSTMGFCTFGDNGTNNYGIYGTDPSWGPTFSYASYFSPIEITFVSLADGVTPATVTGTINAIYGDLGGDTDGIRVRAYDINNNLIGTQTALSVSFGPISISGTGIHRLYFDQSGLGAPTSDTFIEQITYPDPVAIPEPATLLLLAAAATWARRARR